MGQLGFFDLSRRYEGLDVKDDPLVAIAAMIPWESLRPKLKASLITGGLRASDVARKSPAGRPWDEVVIFKALVLQALYNLSDDQAEYQLASVAYSRRRQNYHRLSASVLLEPVHRGRKHGRR
jgi:IS5 family transposase